MIGKIVAGVVVLLIALVAVLLLSRIRLYLRREPGEEMQVMVRFGCIPIPIQKKKKKTRSKKRKKSKPPGFGRQQARRERRAPEIMQEQTENHNGTVQAPPDSNGQAGRMKRWRQGADMLLWAIDVFRDVVRIPKLEVEIWLGSPDAAHTGILLGEASALGGLLLPALQSAFVIDDMRVQIDADFQQEETVWRMNLTLQSRLIHLLRPVVKHYRQLFAWYHEYNN